jgi:hypothetical protein
VDIKRCLMHEISKLRQQRQYVEKRCEMVGKMLPACLILRSRVQGTKDFQSMKTIGSHLSYKSYAYLTCFYQGRNIYRYIPKKDIGGVGQLTESYRIFCQSMQQVREYNRRIVELLDKIGEIQMKEIKDYVKPRTKRISRKKRTK